MLQSRFAFRALLAVTALCLVVACRVRAAAADCPIAITSLSLTAKGATSTSVIYRLDVASADAKPHIFDIDVQTQGSKSTSTIGYAQLLPHVTPGSPSTEYWFTWPSATVTAASVVSYVESDSGKRLTCHSSAVAISDAPRSAKSVVALYDDRQPWQQFPPQLLAQFDLTSSPDMITDSQFIKIVQPEYPRAAMEAGLSADVIVKIIVGPDGNLLDSWVAERNPVDFDAAALKAVRASLYRAPTVNGRATTQEYLVIYTFRTAPGIPSEDLPRCDVALSRFLIVYKESAGLTWYSTRLHTDKAGVTGATIHYVDVRGNEGSMRWQNLVFREDADATSHDKWYSADGAFNWNGPEVKAAWISDFTNGSGSTSVCAPWIEHPMPDPDNIAAPSSWTDGKIPKMALQSVDAADFNSATWPAYPRQLLEAGVRGTASVLVLVDSRGAAREAIISQSSGNLILDEAAVAAAMHSTYSTKPTKEPQGVAAYSVYYEFGSR